MKNNNIVYKIAIICTLFSNYMQAKPRIIVSVQPFLPINKQNSPDTITQSLQKPGKVGSTLLRYGNAPSLKAGIFGTYWGYIGITDYDGILSFIRHTIKPSVKILITPTIEPVMMFGTTVHHWQLKRDTPAALYKMERNTQMPIEWTTTALPIEYNKPISLDTIVLFAHPSKIFVPIGRTPSRTDPNLLLPPVFAKRGITTAANALRILPIKHFFSPVQSVEKKNNNTYYSDLLKP